MAYLDTYSTPLTAATATHLLRRATFGPTQQEIADFTGKTAAQAVDILISNSSYRATPPPPVEMDATRSDAGQVFLGKGFEGSRNGAYLAYIKYWWIGLMCEQNGKPSLLEKLTAFWQNHFVCTYAGVEDHRFMYKYLQFLRANALGDFKTMTTGITKDPAMLIFQNGNENVKEHPNENYGRELQELFTIGQKDFSGNYNYAEQDVKAAARVLTGWQALNRYKEGSTSISTVFSPERHDITDKVFSSYYGGKVIAGRSGADAGDAELNELISMLLSHPECPKFICRKLFRWYVNENITPQLETDVIIPLASFFSSSENNFAIAPVVKKILTSQVFFEAANIGSMIKSPAELMVGSVRFFSQQVPDQTNEFGPFFKMMAFISEGMDSLQLNLLNQPSVFGSLPFYQTGYSRNWINETSLGQRGAKMDFFVTPRLEVKPGYILGVDIIDRLTKIQPNFSDVANTPAITCEDVLNEFLKNLFAIPINASQRDFLIDSIMMMKSSPRTTWIKEWDAFRSAPTDASKKNSILWRCRALLKYLTNMAEYQIY